ncbi:Hypothetical protein GbCGDNIH7_0357 [Granulibacter bethesdensis]|nr:Hypothetical protein GbCGDNIH7_0357 [Granulibacter bethesdensis]
MRHETTLPPAGQSLWVFLRLLSFNCLHPGLLAFRGFGTSRRIVEVRIKLPFNRQARRRLLISVCTGNRMTRSSSASSTRTAPMRASGEAPKAAQPLSSGQRAYEERRAAKAGMSLDKWLTAKRAEAEAARQQAAQPAHAPTEPRKPGFLGRLLERARRPL